MLARLLVLVAAIMPLCAQDSDVTKYLEELRARSVPRDPQGDARRLLADFTKRLETTSDPAQRADLYMGMSGAERTLGHQGAAITAVRSARLLEPGSTPIALALADTLIESGQTGEVPALLAVDPTDGQALIHKADELAHTHPVIAVFCGELAHQLLPADQSVTDTLGTIYMWAGQPSLAGTVFLQAIAAAPQVSTYHYHFGLSMLQRRLKDEARPEFQAALECHPLEDERVAIQAALNQLDPPK
jgi:tetratricopeptide (TPR) repeat protein